MQEHHAGGRVEAAEQDVAPVLGHRRPDAGVQQVLDLGHDLGGLALVDLAVVSCRLARALTAEQRLAGSEVVHHGRQDRGLQMAPVHGRAGLGDGEEVRAEEHPRHPGEGEQFARQGRGQPFVGVTELARSLAHHLAAGQELQHLGVRRVFGLDKHGLLDGAAVAGAQPRHPAPDDREGMRLRTWKGAWITPARWNFSVIAWTDPSVSAPFRPMIIRW